MQATDTFLLTVIFDETYGSLIEDFADKVSDPTHAWYGCYMAREELEAYVRPSDQARTAVDQWLAGYGITPASAQTANVQVRFYVGTRAQIEAAFGSHAARWLDPTIETRADRREWPIPRPIAGLVAQIQVLRGGDGSLEWLDGTYWLQSTAYGVEADSDEKPAGLAGLSPADITEIYEVPQAYSGQGETIAVLMLSHSPAESDLRRFWAGQGIERCPKSADGLPEPLVNIVPIGPQPAQAEGLGALESAMVVEWAGAMAPGARLVVYVIDERTVADPWASFLLAVVGDKKHRPTIACTTWLLPERHYYNTHGARVITGLLNQCAALGITVVSATGDWGCFDSFPRTKDAESQTVADAPWPHAVFPAVEDKVLAVGGTMIPQRSPLTEVAWSGALPISLYNRLAFTSFAGGGGFSMEVPIPSWQRPYLLRLPQLADRRAFSRGPDVPAVLAYGRGIPDVALVSTTRGVMTAIPEDQQVSGPPAGRHDPGLPGPRAGHLDRLRRRHQPGRTGLVRAVGAHQRGARPGHGARKSQSNRAVADAHARAGHLTRREHPPRPAGLHPRGGHPRRPPGAPASGRLHQPAAVSRALPGGQPVRRWAGPRPRGAGLPRCAFGQHRRAGPHPPAQPHRQLQGLRAPHRRLRGRQRVGSGDGPRGSADRPPPGPPRRAHQPGPGHGRAPRPPRAAWRPCSRRSRSRLRTVRPADSSKLVESLDPGRGIADAASTGVE
jgi:hypothetical protein